jgi:3',5'-cyclic AMP phosphodiesterase CpdA
LLIAQVTDIHLGFDRDDPAEFNRKRLDQVLRQLNNGPNRPDLLIVTGDLTEHGAPASYRQLADAFSICSFPVHMGLGNHDIRSNFTAQFPEVPVADGFVQYALEASGVRVLMLDTLEEGRHGGAFCDTRAKWLRSTLAQDRNTPTIIAMHHPPVEIGIAWMNTDPKEQWVSNFTRAIEDAPNVKGIICGHVHRSIAVPWQGTSVAICSSTAPQVALDLNPIDPENPDDRPMIVADQPGYALHLWNGRELVSHFDSAGERAVLAKYDDRLQALIKQLTVERPN